MLVDESGRVRIFHGMNVVYKTEPYHPSTDSFDPLHSLCEEDIENLYKWGFNIVRLGVLWQGVEPQKNQINQTYLDTMGSIVENLGKWDIYSLIDAHQDVWNRQVCGEGFPDWTVNIPDTIKPFPVPVAEPFNNKNGTLEPLLSECLSIPFWSYNYSEVISYLFQALYDNTGGLQDSMISFWGTMASYFKRYNSVIGYDLINEPWPGNIYEDPSLLTNPEKADMINLYPLYQNITNAIRNVDDVTIITYEPMGTDYASPVGFTELPDENSILNYHVYCGLTNTTGVPTNFTECIESWNNEMDIRMNDIVRLNTVGIMSEFGDLSSEPSALALLQHYVDVADEYLQSTMYWQFKFYNDITTQTPFEGLYNFEGELIQEKLTILSRTYAYAIAGTPTLMRFNSLTSEFILKYNIDTSSAKPTEIYLNEEIHYPQGYNVIIEPASWATLEKIDDKNRIAITLSSSAMNSEQLTIQIIAKH